jgi:hypothetical protein
MTGMTNHILPDRGVTLDAELLSPAFIGGAHRPVKVVEHPAFGPRRRLRAEAQTSSMTVLRLPLVSLDPCRRHGPETQSTSMLEVA